MSSNLAACSQPRESIPRPVPQFSTIGDRLRRGEHVADRAFDDVYPFWVRRKARMHWSPVAIAIRASRLLAKKPGARLLDIGAGVGKFCIVASATIGARVRGVEHRAHLVEVAERAAARIGVDATFKRGTLADCDPRDADGIYLFNPFAENVCSLRDHIDETVELSEDRFVRDVAMAEDFLRLAPLGTRVVTYCGFGGNMPPGYERILGERHGGMLELWIKGDHAPRESETRLGPPTSSAQRARVVVEEGAGP
jgi:hypothetical protein